jgi:hypothetical protein
VGKKIFGLQQNKQRGNFGCYIMENFVTYRDHTVLLGCAMFRLWWPKHDVQNGKKSDTYRSMIMKLLGNERD